MERLTIKIRSDLRQYRQRMYLIQRDRWRVIQVCVLGSCLLLLSLTFLVKPWPLTHIFPLAIFSPLLLLLSIKESFRHFTKPLLQSGLLAIVLLCLSIAGGVLHPSTPLDRRYIPSWITLIFPFFTIPLLGRIFKSVPYLARQYSLRPNQPALNLLTGAFIGAILALHFFLIGRYFSPVHNSLISVLPGENLWLLGILAGLVIPAEELLLRGAAFSLHHDNLGNRFSKTAFYVIALNGVLYLALLLYNLTNPDLFLLGLLAIFYKLIIALCTLFLIYKRRNLLAGFATNLVFTFLAGQIFFL